MCHVMHHDAPLTSSHLIPPRPPRPRNVRDTYLAAVGPYIMLPREVTEMNDRKVPIESKVVQA